MICEIQINELTLAETYVRIKVKGRYKDAFISKGGWKKLKFSIYYFRL